MTPTLSPFEHENRSHDGVDCAVVTRKHFLYPLPEVSGARPCEDDLLLIEALRANPKGSHAALADATGRGPAEVRTRLVRLRQQGILLGSRAVVRPCEHSVDALHILCSVTLDSRSTACQQRFAAKARESAAVTLCYRVAADFDYLLQVVVPGMSQFRRLIAELPHIERFTVRTIFGSLPLQRCDRTLPPMSEL